MAKALLIKSPETTNGIVPRYDEQGLPMYRTSIVPVGSRRKHEKRNVRLSNAGYKQLVSIIEEIDVDEQGNPISTKPKMKQDEK